VKPFERWFCVVRFHEVHTHPLAGFKEERMSKQWFKEVPYKCGDDCIQAGCPGHKLQLMYNHTIDWMSVYIDGKEAHAFECGKWAALKQAIKNAEGK